MFNPLHLDLVRLLDSIGIDCSKPNSLQELDPKIEYRYFHAFREDIHVRTAHDLDGDIGTVVTFSDKSKWVFKKKDLSLILPFCKKGIQFT